MLHASSQSCADILDVIRCFIKVLVATPCRPAHMNRWRTSSCALWRSWAPPATPTLSWPGGQCPTSVMWCVSCSSNSPISGLKEHALRLPAGKCWSAVVHVKRCTPQGRGLSTSLAYTLLLALMVWNCNLLLSAPMPACMPMKSRSDPCPGGSTAVSRTCIHAVKFTAAS